MGHSVEIRLPYLDYRLMKFLGRVPLRLKIFGLDEKLLLKRIGEELIPKEILRRKKHPCRAPILKSLLPAGNATSLPLSPERLREAGLFDPSRVTALLKKMKGVAQASEVDGMALSEILSAQILHQSFVSEFRPAAPASPGLLVDRRTAAPKVA